MHYIIARDNLNRDYFPDRLIALRSLNQTIEDMQERCEVLNYAQSQLFYTVIDNLNDMSLDSMYDCNGEVPPFQTFCKYTGLGILPHDGAEVLYQQHFSL